MMQITDTVKHLIIINVLIFLGTNYIGDISQNYDYLALFSFGNEYFKAYQFITHMFMHAPINVPNPNISHIAFNMFALYSFGSALEHYWGAKRFLFFYISCGLVAGLTNNLINYYVFNDIMSSAVGASGAIYGLLVAYGFMFPEATLGFMFIPVPVKAKYFIPFIVAMDLFSGLTGYSLFGQGIAHFAHVGGALAGVVLMLLWRNSKFKQDRWS
jgi:membrane associated rhomboid family serine protease